MEYLNFNGCIFNTKNGKVNVLFYKLYSNRNGYYSTKKELEEQSKICQYINYMSLYEEIRKLNVNRVSFYMQNLDFWNIEQFENLCWFLQVVKCEILVLDEIIFYRVSEKRQKLLLESIDNAKCKNISINNIYCLESFKKRLSMAILKNMNINNINLNIGCLQYLTKIKKLNNKKIFILLNDVNSSYFDIFYSILEINKNISSSINLLIGSEGNIDIMFTFWKIYKILNNNNIKLHYNNYVYNITSIEKLLMDININSEFYYLKFKYILTSCWYLTSKNIISKYIKFDEKVNMLMNINIIYNNMKNNYFKNKCEYKKTDKECEKMNIIKKNIVNTILISKKFRVSKDSLFKIFSYYLINEKENVYF